MAKHMIDITDEQNRKIKIIKAKKYHVNINETIKYLIDQTEED